MSLAIVVTLLTIVVQPMVASRGKEEVRPMVALPPCPGGLERVEFENCKCNAGERCRFIFDSNGSQHGGTVLQGCPYFDSQRSVNDTEYLALINPNLYLPSPNALPEVYEYLTALPRVDDRFRADCGNMAGVECSCGQWTEPQWTSEGSHRPNLENVADEAEAKRARRADEIQLDEVNVEMHLAMLPSKQRSTLKDVLQCPISQQFMADPVIAADGHTYERSSIESWFRSKGKPVSPITHTDLANDKVIQNWAVRKILQDFSAAELEGAASTATNSEG